ncbi:MAG: putative polysaccharide biosynthesis protein [Halanaerobium sp.]
MSDNKKFLKGALTLGTAGIISKIMGFAYRIALPRIIGAEGVGIYQLAYPMYTILLVISTSGIPIALAKLISKEHAKKNYKKVYQIFEVCKKLNFILGLLLSIVMLACSKIIIEIFSWDPRAVYSVAALSPAVFIVSLISAYRGFFQGLQNMKPTAYSQVIEQFFRITAMILLVNLLLPYGVEYAAAAATSGAVFGGAGALIFLKLLYLKKQDKILLKFKQQQIKKYDFKKNSLKILSLAIPITFGALITPLMGFVDAAIVPSRLKAGGFLNATSLYGHLSGMAMVLVHFPTIITLALSTSLVPAVSEAFALNDEKLIKSRAEIALRITILIALPSAVGLFLLSEPLSAVIFGTPAAAVPLNFLAWGVIFIALKQTTSAMLQGLGRVKVPAKNLFIGAVINAVINYTLTAHPAFGIRGAALGTVTGFMTASFLNLIYVKKWTEFNVDFNKFFLKPIFSVLIMSAAVKIVQKITLFFLADYSLFKQQLISLSTSVFAGIIIYSAALILVKEIKYDDLVLIPVIGPKTAALLRKYKLIS